jgi:hypothetical protein
MEGFGELYIHSNANYNNVRRKTKDKLPNAQLAVWRKRGVISLDSSCELPNDKNLVEAASAPRLRQAAERYMPYRKEFPKND